MRTYALFALLLMLLPSAYSFAILLFAFTIRCAMNAAIRITTIRPGMKPLPREPVVISVPIWYTKNAIVKPVANYRPMPPNSHFLLLISEFIAPIAAKQGGVYRLNIRYARAATFVRPIMVAT